MKPGDEHRAAADRRAAEGRPRRVLYVLPSNVLGSEFYRGLRLHHDPRRVQLFFASLGESERADTGLAGHPIESFGLGAPKISQIPRAVFALAALLRRLEIDIVHGHLFWPSLVGWAAARIARRPAVLTSRLYSDLLAREGHHLRPRLEGLAASWTDTVISVSDFMTRYLVEQERVPRGKIETIYLGIMLDRFKPPPAAAVADFRRRHGLQSPFLVGCTGRLVREKAYDHALHAFRQVLRDAPEARLAIAGRGPLEPDLRRLAEALGIQDRVSFLGQLPVEELVLFYAGLDVFLHPSLSEGLGQVTLEAMALHRPCIAYRVGPLPEAIEDGRTGLLVPEGDQNMLADALLRLQRDPETRAAMGDRARSRVETVFDFSTMCRRHEALYDRLASNPAPTAASARGPD